MPARDVIHDAVRTALEKDGWYTLFAQSPAIQMLLHDNQVPLIIVNPESKEVVEWVRK